MLVDSETGAALFGLNIWRQEYELPGGIVEDGETFADAARRELAEETAIDVAELELRGFARFVLTSPSREELGAVYCAEITGVEPSASDEMQRFIWRQPLAATTDAISALDDAIADWVIRTR